MKRHFKLVTLAMTTIAFFAPQKLEASAFKYSEQKEHPSDNTTKKKSSYGSKYTVEQKYILEHPSSRYLNKRTRKSIEKGHSLTSWDTYNIHKAYIQYAKKNPVEPKEHLTRDKTYKYRLNSYIDTHGLRGVSNKKSIERLRASGVSENNIDMHHNKPKNDSDI